MSQDGSRAWLADQCDPSTPWARTASDDVSQALGQSMTDSSARVDRANDAHAQQRALGASAQEQSQSQAQTQGDPGTRVQRMA